MPVDGLGAVSESEDTMAEAALRAEVRTWLEENWDPNTDAAEWRSIVVDSGWAFSTWPTQWYGRGIAPDLHHVVVAEFDRRKPRARRSAPPTTRGATSWGTRCWRMARTI